MDDATLARDRLLMAVLLSMVVHILVLFGPFGPDIASPPRITTEMPLTLELQRSVPQRTQPIGLVIGAAPDGWRVIDEQPRGHQRHIDGTTRDEPAARYLRDWILRAEAVGNRVYPRALIEADVTGRVIMAVTLNASGEIVATRMLGKGTRPALEQAARRLVEAAAPFPAVPPEVLQGRDELVITRTWSFGEAVP
ncbi:energy transducer TonB [Spiribacter onubensis]|uniref:TonB family protein n=1 Tax=Spiribacter onubensis TaxID=3122420 RepID=A0ABV3SA21_9GAMM